MIHTNDPIIDELIDRQIARKTVRINCYTCQNGHLLLSHDKDSGVTPMFDACSCEGRSSSNFYTPTSPEVIQAMLTAETHKELNTLEHVIPHIIWFNPANEQEFKLAIDSYFLKNPEDKILKSRITKGCREHWKKGGLISLYTNRFMEFKK